MHLFTGTAFQKGTGGIDHLMKLQLKEIKPREAAYTTE